jgi:hypothetical protein
MKKKPVPQPTGSMLIDLIRQKYTQKNKEKEKYSTKKKKKKKK